MRLMKSSSSLGKRVHQRKGIVHSIKLVRKEIHQGKIRFWESIKLWEKREGHQARKDFNNKMREKWMQEFSSSCERILIHQKTQKTWDSMKDHSSWEGNEDLSKAKFNQIEEDEEKKK